MVKLDYQSPTLKCLFSNLRFELNHPISNVRNHQIFEIPSSYTQEQKKKKKKKKKKETCMGYNVERGRGNSLKTLPMSFSKKLDYSFVTILLK